MPGFFARGLIGAVLAVGLGACSTGDFELSNVNLLPKLDNPFADSKLAYRGAGGTTTRPVTAEDLVSADGSCVLPQAVADASAQADGAASDAGNGMDGASAMVRGGIALQMTECEVVARAGHTSQIQIGANERNERAVTLTYLQGPWPGIYKFEEGRLVSIDRVAEPAKPKAKRKRS